MELDKTNKNMKAYEFCNCKNFLYDIGIIVSDEKDRIIFYNSKSVEIVGDGLLKYDNLSYLLDTYTLQSINEIIHVVLLTLPIVRKLMASSAAQQTKTLSDCRFFNPESVNLTTIPDNLFPSSFLRQ